MVIVTKESVTPTDITLNVSMASEDEEPFIGRSYRRLASRVKIPGFRPGKAPRSIVESHLGRTALVQEALEFMIPETLDQVLSDEDIQAFADPQLELLEIEPVSFKAVVPLEPLVDLGDFRSIQVDREPVTVSEDQVDEVIEQLRSEAAPWDPVERPVQFGDLLNLNVDGTIEGDQAINDKGVDFIPQEDNPMPMPGFSSILEGMTAGETKEFSLIVPEDHNQEEYAGKECQFKVEVLSVKEKQLAELDDEFAKSWEAERSGPPYCLLISGTSPDCRSKPMHRALSGASTRISACWSRRCTNTTESSTSSSETPPWPCSASRGATVQPTARSRPPSPSGMAWVQ